MLIDVIAVFIWVNKDRLWIGLQSVFWTSRSEYSPCFKKPGAFRELVWSKTYCPAAALSALVSGTKNQKTAVATAASAANVRKPTL